MNRVSSHRPIQHFHTLDRNRDVIAGNVQMPPGAFGVWQGAPVNGIFALFEMTATKELPPADEEYFRSTLGMPVLALESGEETELQAAVILEMLSQTVKGVRSAAPGDPSAVRDSLKRMKTAINQGFRKINLVESVQPRLICFLEMRRA